MAPLQAIRKFCIQCVGSSSEVKHCGGHKMYGQVDENGQCWFYLYRMGRGRPSVKMIRKNCLECCGGSRKLVAQCSTFSCPVYAFRFASNPNRIRQSGKNLAKETA